MDDNTKIELKLFYIDLVERLTSKIDAKVESITIEYIRKKYDIIREILIAKLNDLLKEVMNRINKNINPNIHFFLHNFQLFIFNTFDTKHNYSFNKVVFRILYKHIQSKDTIVYVDKVCINELDSPQFHYLNDHNISVDLKIKSIKIIDIDSLKYLPKNINGLYLRALRLKNEDLEDLNEFTNLSYIDVSHNKLTKFSYTNDSLLELNIEGNDSLKELKLNNTIESINLKYIYNIDLATLQSIKSLKHIKLSEDVLKQNLKYFNKFKLFEYDKSFILSYGINESLDIKTEANIENEKIKFLKIESDVFPKLNCINLVSLKVSANHVNCNNLKDLHNLKDLNMISYSSDYTFNFPILNNLTILTLSHISFPENYIFPKLENLLELNISGYNNLYDENIFSLLTSLETLDLFHGKITNKTFTNLINLKKLSLHHIKYYSYEDDIFDTLHNLIFLKLRFTSLPACLKLRNLEYLYFESSNSLDITELHNLKILDLWDSKIDDNSIINHQLLESLTLTFYKINTDFIFNPLPNLRRLILYISYNNYDLLNKDIFSNLLNLESLTIYVHHQLPLSIFHCLTKLKNLYIDGCNNLSFDMFKNFKCLEYLKLGWCNKIDLSELIKNNPNLMYCIDNEKYVKINKRV